MSISDRQLIGATIGAAIICVFIYAATSSQAPAAHFATPATPEYSSPSSPTEEVQNVLHTSLRAIQEDFASNGLAAADKYSGKIVVVTGTLGSINSAFGTISTFLTAGQSAVIAGFDIDPKYLDALKSLKSGQKVTVACDVSFGGMLANCALVTG